MADASALDILKQAGDNLQRLFSPSVPCGQLTASVNGVWVCPNGKNVLHVCRGSLIGESRGGASVSLMGGAYIFMGGAYYSLCLLNLISVQVIAGRPLSLQASSPPPNGARFLPQALGLPMASCGPSSLMASSSAWPQKTLPPAGSSRSSALNQGQPSTACLPLLKLSGA